MSLPDEIRKVLSLNNNMTPEDIRRVVFDRRIYGLHQKQSIKTFKNVMATMPDIQTYVDNNGIWKRRLIMPTLADKIELNALRWIARGMNYYNEGMRLCEKMARQNVTRERLRSLRNKNK